MFKFWEGLKTTTTTTKKPSLLRTLIQTRFLWETSKENPGAEGSSVPAAVGGIFTAESVLPQLSAAGGALFHTKWKSKKFCGHQRLPGLIIKSEDVCPRVWGIFIAK